MKVRHVLIVGVLVFLNGFVFTIVLLMASRELARPAPTPGELPTATPTLAPADTLTPAVPAATLTALATATSTLEPAPTNTQVVAPATSTPTTGPPSATATPGAPTATSVPPTATPTAPEASPTTPPTATATPGPDWDFEYVTYSMRTSPNCAGPYFAGVILGQGGARTNGISVHFWLYDVHDCKVSGEGKPTGEWGFDPALESDLKNTHIEFYIQVVDNCTNLAPRSEALRIPFDRACDAGQFEDITFRYTR